MSLEALFEAVREAPGHSAAVALPLLHAQYLKTNQQSRMVDALVHLGAQHVPRLLLRTETVPRVSCAFIHMPCDRSVFTPSLRACVCAECWISPRVATLRAGNRLPLHHSALLAGAGGGDAACTAPAAALPRRALGVQLRAPPKGTDACLQARLGC